MDIAISVEGLVKNYGTNNVINDLSFYVNKGEIFALLGANGAGKTTTLECIEGLRKYDAGRITINGSIGVQLQSTSLPNNITVIEAIRLFSKWNKTKVDDATINKFGLDNILKKQYETLSSGQKRRLHLVLALINNPDIIFLDEPTAGLDVEGRMALHTQIRKLKEDGKTIVMASHDMAEVEDLCDRVAIIKKGKIAFIGTTKELTSSFESESKILIKTINPIENETFTTFKSIGISQGYLTLSTYKIADALLELLNYIKVTSNTVIDIKVERASLEERFIKIAKEAK